MNYGNNNNLNSNSAGHFMQPSDTKSPDIDLISFEKLDRSSPELWPEIMPGLCDFASIKTVFSVKHVFCQCSKLLSFHGPSY